MTGQPRTAQKARGKYEHFRSWRQTALTRAIGQDRPPRPRRPRIAAARQPRVRADPTFGRLLALGYYDDYRKAFDHADD
jgi:hypothetical protein